VACAKAINSTYAVCKGPTDCLPADLQAFYEFVRRGGEVGERTLLALIRRARALGFLYDGAGSLIGTGAIKCPNDSHRTDLFRNATSTLDSKLFPLEAGWFLIHKDWRGCRLSQKLLEPLCMPVSEGTYATCKETNNRMHRGLIRQGFKLEGGPWIPEGKQYKLRLFVRPQR
jgi:hypothetical protein